MSMTASEMAKLSWEKRKAKQDSKYFSQLSSKRRNRKGGRPKKLDVQS